MTLIRLLAAFLLISISLHEVRAGFIPDTIKLVSNRIMLRREGLESEPY